LIQIFQGNEFSLSIEILNSDGSKKDLTGLTVTAGIKCPDGTIVLKNCVIEDVGLISLPLLATDTAQVGVYTVEIRLEKTGYKETWKEFNFEVKESIILKGTP
jgi:hypothetical protein